MWGNSRGPGHFFDNSETSRSTSEMTAFSANQTIPQRRAFKVHPSIIKTLIHEQAGSLPKAVAELVMNSVDAGATRIDMTVDIDGRFEFADDGKGFQSSEEIEQFFDTFGTPHTDDSPHFGRFRCGRGQIMSYASTIWRSGKFEMRVDLNDAALESGYDLIEHEESHTGCRITGRFYKFKQSFQTADYSLRTFFTGYPGGSAGGELGLIVRYVPIPIFVNGQQINHLAADESWDHEDDHAWYRFSRDADELHVYNRGVSVTRYPAGRFGAGGVVCTEVPLELNLARNSVIESRCATWQAIVAALEERFAFHLTRVKKLTETEAAALLRDLYFSDKQLNWKAQGVVGKLRFVPDIFGKLVTPVEGLSGDRFTLFDGEHTGIAERVHREGLATVVMPRLLSIANARVSEENLGIVLSTLRRKLSLGGNRETFSIVPFSHFVQQLNDTATLLDDAELDPEERLALESLRLVNRRIFKAVWPDLHDYGLVRRLVAGVTDAADAWTDGSTFIAIHRGALSGIRHGGPLWLVTLLIHEYAHPETSLGEHHHDFDFLSRFHEATRRMTVSEIVDDAFRYYVQGLTKLGKRPSSHHGTHIRAMAVYADRLPKRGMIK